VPGGADDSYGIEVANLAGVPKSVISRANKVLSDLIAGKAPEAKRRSAPEPMDMQVSFESAAENEVIERIRKADINTMTPLEALNLLYSLKKEVQK
jgi:DNA mismatch repair protein MutS